MRNKVDISQTPEDTINEQRQGQVHKVTQKFWGIYSQGKIDQHWDSKL